MDVLVDTLPGLVLVVPSRRAVVTTRCFESLPGKGVEWDPVTTNVDFAGSPSRNSKDNGSSPACIRSLLISFLVFSVEKGSTSSFQVQLVLHCPISMQIDRVLPNSVAENMCICLLYISGLWSELASVNIGACALLCLVVLQL